MKSPPAAETIVFKNEIIFRIIRAIDAEQNCSAQVNELFFSLSNTKFVHLFMNEVVDGPLAEVFLEYCAKREKNIPVIVFRAQTVQTIITAMKDFWRDGFTAEEIQLVLECLDSPKFRKRIKSANNDFITRQIRIIAKEIFGELRELALTDPVRLN